MSELFLYEKIGNFVEYGGVSLDNVPDIIKSGLSKKIELREYQKEAIGSFVYYYNSEKLRKNKQVHTLFHMATGSGKTVMMASLILYLYTKGYRKFIFFVNRTNIVEKTKENFINSDSSKYLFNEEIRYLGNKININMVDTFSEDTIDDDIEIIFTTVQKLHDDLGMIPARENSMTREVFEDNKIVFISDESHHINTTTKNKSKSTDSEEEKTWESSVNSAFHSNKDSIMLEFTATADLKDPNVKSKYRDKIVYDYPLMKFRKSGYTKDFWNFKSYADLWGRTLMALIMSEYRKFLFADLKLNIKPVVLLKSKNIAPNKEFYEEFFEKLNDLTVDELKELYSSDNKMLIKALDYFKGIDETFEVLKGSLQSSFVREKSIIMNNDDDLDGKTQILLNSLEDKDNPIRFIFTVDKLVEGWDVLNLYDIVRLFDTRQGGKSNPAPYTIKEAQLIGRGARYCPFKASDEQDKYKRKYDNDLDNDYRILETLYFHSRNDSKYISELTKALKETQLLDEDPIELEYKLKDSFKETDFYKKGYVFSNKRIPVTRTTIREIEGSLKTKKYSYTVSSNKSTIGSLISDDNEDKQVNSFRPPVRFYFHEIPYNILLGASERFNELKFDIIKDKYPNVKSVREFLTGENYLGNSYIEVIHYDEIKSVDLYNACVNALINIANHIVSLKPEYKGTKEFSAKSISTVLKDKKIYVSSRKENGGHGHSQTNCPNPNYQMDLTNEDWYVFTDNFGTSEEKLFVKYFKTNIEPKLKKYDLEYYVVRNERVVDFAIYTFNGGERLEPDFLLFVRKKGIDKHFNTQVYVEPKGGDRLQEQEWKEKFLLEIEDNHTIVNLLADEFKIIGMPFFNEQEKTVEFDKAVEALITKL